MLNNLGMGFVFTAQDFASAKMRGLEKTFASLDRTTEARAARIHASVRKVALGLGALAAGGIAVGGSFALAGKAGTFEQGLAAVQAVTRATTRELGMLRQAAIQAGIVTQFSPDEAVGGLQSLATAGQTAEQATRTLIPVLDLAAGSLGQLGVAESAEAVVGTLNAYGLAADHAAGVTDRLLRITQLTNFQTRDFEAGLSKAAATGAVFSQSLDDVLIGMGLLRNRNIDASSSATAFREAVRRVGSDQRAQNALIGAGVKVFDEHTGRMRSILDIMSDFAQRTRTMTEAERNARVNTAFGARGLLAFNAAMNAAFTTTRDGVQVTLQGAEAIAAMREELGRAEGTAAGFRATLLDTFEGQKTLLRGVLQTLAVVLGEPFAKVLKPVVAAVVRGINALIRAIEAIPAPVKQALAAFVVVAGAVLALIGAILVAKGAVALLAIGLNLLGVTVAGILATLLPAAILVGLLAAAVTGFGLAVRRDIGGLGTFVSRVFDRIRLFVRAMGQLVSQGGFSGAVREELAKAENQGVKQFAIRVFQIVFRIRRFFEGIAAGFGAAIEASRPAFEAFIEALGRLGQAFGFVGATADSVAGLQSDTFAASGARVGEVLGRIATFLVQVLTAVTDVVTGMVEGFRTMGEFLGDVFGYLRNSFGELGAEIQKLLTSMGLLGSEGEASGTTWMEIGRVLGKAIGGIAGVIGLALTGIVRVVRGALRLIRHVGESLGRFAAGLVQLFTDPIEGIQNLLGGLVGVVLSLADAVLSIFGITIDDIQGTVDGLGRALATFFTATLPGLARRGLSAVADAFLGIGQRIVDFFTEKIPNAFRTIVEAIASFFSPVVEFIQSIFRTIMNAIDRMIAFLGRIASKIPSRFRPDFLDSVVAAGDAASERIDKRSREAHNAAARPLIPMAATSAMPAVAEAGGQALSDERLAEAIVQSGVAASQAAEKMAQRPIHVRLDVDGQTLAQTTVRAQREDALRRFAPVPGT